MVSRQPPFSPSATRCLPANRLTFCLHYSLHGFSQLMSIWVCYMDRTGQDHREWWLFTRPARGATGFHVSGGRDGAGETGLLEGVWHAWHCCAGG